MSDPARTNPLVAPMPILLLLTVAACADNRPPAIDSLSIGAASPDAPLARSVVLRADEPVTVTFRVAAAGAQWIIDPEIDFAVEHRLPLVGLRAGTDHRVVVVARDAAGNETAAEAIELVTDPLPDDFPQFVVRASEPELMEPGPTLFNLMRWPEEGSDDDFGAVVVVDARGDVIWYYLAEHDIGDVRLQSNGHMVYETSRGRVIEVDMLGNVVTQWHAQHHTTDPGEASISVETETIHHEIFEMPSGNLLTVSTEVRDYDDYPSSTVDRQAPTQLASVVGDIIVEFSRDGRVRRELKLLDIIDPTRTSTNGGLGGDFWQEVYGDQYEGTLVDWAHVNAVFYDAESNAFIVSSRVQDAVIKIDADSGELVWILGQHDGWSSSFDDYLLAPQGDLVWPNHQHAPMVTPEGTILLFDNGTNRGGPFAEARPTTERYSRAVEYAVDETTMEVREVWSHGGPGSEQFYSSFISDADWMPVTGNVLITVGGLIADESRAATEASDGRRSARITEVTHETPAQKVFDLTVETDWTGGGWHVYRAQRIASLYGGGS